MKKQQFLGLSVMILALCLIFVGCDSGGDESDSWSTVTSLSQVNGTWQGSMSETMPIKQFAEDFFGEEFDEEAQAVFGNMSVNVRLDVSVTINSSTGFMSQAMTQTITFSGGNIVDVWPVIKTEFSGPGVIVSDSNHSVTYSDSGTDYITDNDLGGVEINQNGNKLREPASNYGFSSGKYFIYNKQ